MILENKETTVAYRCPECGVGVMLPIGLFALKADMVRLKCPCGGSELSAVYTKDGKIRLDVPCFVCKRTHSFTLSPSLFFSQEMFLIPCGVSGYDICFIGKQKDVMTALTVSDEEIRRVLEDAGIENFKDVDMYGEDKVLPDAQIYDIVRFIMCELDAEGKVSCDCKAGEGEYDLEITSDGVCVFCNKCGAQKVYSAESVSDASSFLAVDEMKLEQPVIDGGKE